MLAHVLAAFTYLRQRVRYPFRSKPWPADPVVALPVFHDRVIAQVEERNALLREMAARGALESPGCLRICSCGMAVHRDWPDCSVGCLYASD